MRLVVILCLCYLLAACGGAAGGSSASAANSSVENVTEYTVIEGSGENTSVTVPFTSTITGLINYETVNVDAVAKSDYVALSGSLDVVAGQRYELAVEILSDTRIEADEKLNLKLVDGAGETWLTISINIINDDFPVFTIAAIDATEGNIGSGKVQYGITLSETTISPFPLVIKTLDTNETGYGLAGKDYTAISEEITFLKDELSKTIDIEIFGDLDIELDEKVQLQVQHLDKQTEVATALIRTDDFPGQGAPTFIVNEGRSVQTVENEEDRRFSMPFSIDETGGFTAPFTLNYKLREIVLDPSSGIENDLAVLDKDFSDNLTQIEINPDTKDYTANFSIIDDTDLERTEILEFVLFNDAGVIFGSGRVYISDNEAPEFKIYRQYTNSAGNTVTSDTLNYIEGSNAIGDHKVIVELAGDAGYDFDFEYVMRLANAGEATHALDSNDFVQNISGSTVQSKVLTIGSGGRRPTGIEQDGIAFTISDDANIEGNESFFIELMNINGTPIGDAVEIKILNDDLPQIQWVNTNPQAPATVSKPFLTAEEGMLSLELQLIGNTGLGASALENFNISVNQYAVSSPVCDWKDTNVLSNNELITDFSNSRVFTEGAQRLNFDFRPIDDNEVECDEVVGFRATIQSQNEGVSQQLTSDMVLTVVNADKAQVDVYGFSQNESISAASFRIALNNNIKLSAEFLLQQVDAELSDASFELDGLAIVPSAINKNSVSFDGNSTSQEKVISVNINNDTVVELDERYRLSLNLLSSVSLTNYPIEIRACGLTGPSSCTALPNAASIAVVDGVILNDELLTLTLQAKNTTEVNESALTPLSVLDLSVAYPYEFLLSHQIASDVPEIKIKSNDLCLITPASDCADGNDFTIADTVIHDGINDTTLARRDLNAKLLSGDDTVEPDEFMKLGVVLDPAGTANSLVSGWTDASISYSIIDNDKLTISVLNSVAGAFTETDLNTDVSTDISVQWDKNIASNVPSIELSLVEICDENLDATCFITTDSGSQFTGDIEFDKTFTLHSNGGATSLNTVGRQLGVLIKGDDVVEVNEQGSIRITMNDISTVSSYLTASWTTQLIPLAINNNDLLVFSFNALASNVTEGALGQTNSAGVQLSWDKAIASNVPSISFQLTENCDNGANSHCVSDLLGNDFNLSNTVVSVHGNGVDTAVNTALDLGISIVGDAIVEPNESAVFNLDLNNPTVINPFLNSTWSIQSQSLLIDNDDVVTPQLVFTDEPNNATGLEDTDKDLSSGNEVGLVMSWGAVAIADNADDLIFQITDACSACGGADNDYSISNAEFNITTESAGGQRAYPFTITLDSKVEPDEVVEIKMLRKSSTPDHYFSTPPVNHEFSALSYTIENDDRLVLSIVRSDGLSGVALPESTSQLLDLKWTGYVAENTPNLAIEQSEQCDNNNADTSLPKCLSATTSLNNSPADISIASTSQVHVSGSEIDASSVAQTRQVAITQNDDAWVEVDEALKLNFTIPVSMQSYLRFEKAGTDNTNPSYTLDNNYQLIGDDILQVSINNASTSNPVSDESASASITYPLSFSHSVEQDVSEMKLSVLEGNTPATIYGTRSVTFSDSSDYRIFYGSQVEADFLMNDIVIKELGESLTTASNNLIVAVGDDDVVESDEVVAFSLSENNDQIKLFDSGSEVLAGNATTERKFTILLEDKLMPGIRFSNDFISTEILAVSEADNNQSVSAILTGLKAIDSNVGDLAISISISCKTVVPMTCDNSEMIIPADVTLEHASLTDQSLISLGLMTEGDNVIEPDETVIVSLSASSNSQYFDFPASASREFTLLNDDYLSIQLMDNSSGLPEGDAGDTEKTITVSIADDGAGIEGLTTIPYTIDQSTTSQDDAEETGAVKDFDLSGSVGNRSVSLTGMQAPLTSSVNHTLATINTDTHVEANEALLLNTSFNVPAGFINGSSPLNLSKQYEIVDDDFLTTIISGSKLQNENSGQYKILVCDSLKGGVEQDLILNVVSAAALVDSGNDEYLPVHRAASVGVDYSLSSSSLAVSKNDFSNTNTYMNHDCTIKNLPLSLAADSDIETDEWFSVNVSTVENYLCAGGSNECLEANLVILNDDYLSILDTGVDTCITGTGAIETPGVNDVCSGLSKQDVEIDFNANEYTYLDSLGSPILPRQLSSKEEPPVTYACISDNYTGLIWSIERLPFDGVHSTDGKAWSGSVVSLVAEFNTIISSPEYCGLTLLGKTWRIPSVEQLLAILDYSKLETDSVFEQGIFKNETLSSESVYWTVSSCDTDNDLATKEYWTVNMKKGTTACSPVSDSYLIRAVYH